MSGQHSLCKDCRASSSAQRTVYVVEPGARIEVTTELPIRSSSSRRGESRSNYSSADSYRDAGRYLGRDEWDIERDIAGGYPHAHYPDTRPAHESLGASYVRPRIHPYSDRYEYVSRYTQSGYPSYGGMHPSSAQRDNASSYAGYYAGHQQFSSENYQPQSSYATTQQAPGQKSQVQYVYSGTEGPDGEKLD